ncbi:unnamed protein product [Sphenostylis stenocarpa]|uniref:Uncharacterized protein n=1 Tax=Sphenostylis stenocarpa TaxID=92480 RepID=A0AA86T0J9_9FABA|nr:unnamed protein product [Sphenostylis stenocarpa]
MFGYQFYSKGRSEGPRLLQFAVVKFGVMKSFFKGLAVAASYTATILANGVHVCPLCFIVENGTCTFTCIACAKQAIIHAPQNPKLPSAKDRNSKLEPGKHTPKPHFGATSLISKDPI